MQIIVSKSGTSTSLSNSLDKDALIKALGRKGIKVDSLSETKSSFQFKGDTDDFFNALLSIVHQPEYKNWMVGRNEKGMCYMTPTDQTGIPYGTHVVFNLLKKIVRLVLK